MIYENCETKRDAIFVLKGKTNMLKEFKNWKDND